jgi:hypothetical protein
MCSLGDYIIAMLATALVIYATGRLLIAAHFAARRRHFHQTMVDIARGEQVS